MPLTRQPHHKSFRARGGALRQWYDEPEEGTRAWFVWRLDRLVSLIVRRRDGHACVICKSGRSPQAAHIFSRKYYATRWDLENVWTNCDFHNRLHNTNRDPYTFWAVKMLGPERFEALRDRALSGAKVETWQMAELLTELKEAA